MRRAQAQRARDSSVVAMLHLLAQVLATAAARSLLTRRALAALH